jgi:hypothetical protein
MSAEQLERCRKGLCFNCDEPYAPGHTCAHLFYLETIDDAKVEALTAELTATILSEAGVTTYGPVHATAFVVSLHAMAGIKTAKTMLLPVMIHGERLTVLVDTGSMHNFLSRDAMRRLALQRWARSSSASPSPTGTALLARTWHGRFPSSSAMSPSPSIASASTWAATTSFSVLTSCPH